MWSGSPGHQSLYVRHEDDGATVVTVDGNTVADGKVGVVAERRRQARQVLAYYSAPPGVAPATEPSTSRGIDVSDCQGPLDWHAAKRAGFAWMVAKLSDGRDLDDAGPAHVKAARDAGLRVGSYHFWIPWRSCKEQIEALACGCDLAGLGDGDLAPVLDVESWRQSDPTLSREARARRRASPGWVPGILELADAVALRYGAVWLYHNEADFELMGRPSALTRWPLWAADYRDAAPAWAPWVAWQQTGSGRVLGAYDGPLDLSVARAALPTIGGPDVRGLELDDETLARVATSLAFDAEAHRADRARQIQLATDRGRYG